MTSIRWTELWRRFSRKFFYRYGRMSYAQCGEDLMAAFFFDALRIARPSYWDIGAFHASQLSNTYYFYRRGARGVCVEANPARCRRIQRVRSKDLCINAGIAKTSGENLDFYVMSWEALSTFSKKDAEELDRQGRVRIVEVLRVPCLTFPELLERYRLETPDFLSIDVEGLELEALQAFDFKRRRPRLLCVETLTYSENKQERKQKETLEWLAAQDYLLMGDTYVNSVFVDRKAWTER